MLAVMSVLAATAVATPWVIIRPADSAQLASGPATQGAQPDEAPGQLEGGQRELLQRGEELYIQACSSCHGPAGGGLAAPDGSLRGPSILEAGEAGAYFYLSTGRMPMGSSEDRPVRKPPAFDDDDIEALVAYVADLGDGPSLPEVEPEGADVAQGGVLFREHCQACHSAAGAGGALSYGRAAPPLAPATLTETAAAVRIGPGQMPVFGPDIIDDDQLDQLLRYVTYLREPEDPGGLPIGRVGPIPEGFVAWLVGMAGLLGLVAWIGTRNPVRRRGGEHQQPVAEGAESERGGS